MRVALVVFLISIHGIAFAGQKNAPANIVEQRLMQNLACTCPTCNLEPIERCRCDLATQMRGEVKEALRDIDISTSDKRESAYLHVRNVFAAKYGPAVLTPNETKTDPRMNWLPIIIFAGGAVSFVLITRRSINRRRKG